MRAILQLVSVPSNPITIVYHFRRSHPLCEHSYSITNLRTGMKNRTETVKQKYAYDAKIQNMHDRSYYLVPQNRMPLSAVFSNAPLPSVSIANEMESAMKLWGAKDRPGSGCTNSG